jgi:phosphate transport system substrate-binding protein
MRITLLLVHLMLAGFVLETGPLDRMTIKGSDTMRMLATAWAKTFQLRYPDVQIDVEGGGSGVGISALIEGRADVCASSRRIRPSEVSAFRARYKTEPVEIAVARDGIGIFVHESNRLTELSTSAVRKIFTGQIRNWKEVGGPDLPIILYGRDKLSGTTAFMQDELLGNEGFDPSITVFSETNSILQAVAAVPGAIGYGSSAYGLRTKELRLRPDGGADSFFPSAKNIREGTYPLTRTLYLYHAPRPRKTVVQFIEWVRSEDAQSIIGELGYLPPSP